MARRHFVALLCLAGLAFPPHAARAAQSYDNCAGYIDALPATISTGGTWCLRKDLATNIASGIAVDIQVDDVTIDCNGFKIGGLAAGDGSQAYGIAAIPAQYARRRNLTVRNCNIRGFNIGIALYSSIGILVEDNRLDNNLAEGIDVQGGWYGQIRRNAVYDTGGFTVSTTAGHDALGILATVDVIDNIVDGVFSSGDSGDAIGLRLKGGGMQVSGNRIGGLTRPGAYGMTYGIDASLSPRTAIAGNLVTSSVAVDGTHGYGIAGSGYCSGNTVANFATPLLGCTDDGGNASL